MSKPQSLRHKTFEEGLVLLIQTIQDLEQKMFNYSKADYAQEKYIAEKQKVIDSLKEAYRSINCLNYSATWEMLEFHMKDLEKKDAELSGCQFNFITKATGFNLSSITYNPLKNENF